MNKELREDLEHIIICNDKTITQDLRDDVKMTLDYIDVLEKENEILKDNSYHNDKVVDKVNWENRLLKNKINKTIEYIKEHKKLLGEIYNKEPYVNGDKLLNILEGKDE